MNIEMISSPENSSDCKREAAVQELRRGWEFAKQLKNILASNESSRNNCDSAEDLLMGILNSFTNTISVFDDESPTSTRGRNKSEDSEGTSKRTTTCTTKKGRRGCYKRKKSTDSWKTETLNWVDDGHAWRKYGQKLILNCKYPRNYFRCTYKSNGCQATKQVQQIRDNPPMYRTTYHAKHTCQDFPQPKQVLIPDKSAPDSSVFLCFDNDIQANKQDYPFFSYDYIPSIDHFPAFGSSMSSDHANSCTAGTLNFEFDDDVLRQYYGC